MSYTKITALAFSAALLAACNSGDSDSDSDSDSTGSLSLSVTDAPVDSAKAVVVEFTGVELLRADEEPVGFTFDEARQIDLLALQGGVSTALLDGVEVPAGTYEQIRLKVNAGKDASDSYIELDDGGKNALFIPSGNQTGLKLTDGITVPQGGSADFTIDFDLRKSVTNPPGLGGSYILKPTLRLVQTDVVGAIGGTVSGELAAVEGCSAAVYVYAGTDGTPDDEGSEAPPLSSAQVAMDDGTGHFNYTAAFLNPGDYTVAFTCNADEDDPEIDDAIAFEPAKNATVVTGETAEVNFE